MRRVCIGGYVSDSHQRGISSPSTSRKGRPETPRVKTRILNSTSPVQFAHNVCGMHQTFVCVQLKAWFVQATASDSCQAAFMVAHLTSGPNSLWYATHFCAASTLSICIKACSQRGGSRDTEKKNQVHAARLMTTWLSCLSQQASAISKTDALGTPVAAYVNRFHLK